MPPKTRSKTTAESPNSGSDAVEAAREGRLPTLVEQTENIMNSSNNPIEQVEGRGADNVNMPILFSNIFNEFQALMQEIKNQQMIIPAFMEEMK